MDEEASQATSINALYFSGEGKSINRLPTWYSRECTDEKNKHPKAHDKTYLNLSDKTRYS